MAITPESTPDEIREALKDIDPKDRPKVREITREATPRQVFETVIPYQFSRSETASEKLAGLEAIFQFLIEGEGGGEFALVIKDGDLSVKSEKHESPNCTITMQVDDWKAMNRGEIEPQVAFMSGKIQFAGDMSLAMRLGAILRPQ